MAGCGGGDNESTANDAPRLSAAGEPAQAFVTRLAKLLETTTAKKDCPQLEQINQRSYTRFSCPPVKELRESMDAFEVVGVREYGTGAVVDYRSGKVKDGAAIVLFVVPDRNWGIGRFGVVTEPSTETSDEDSREGFEQAVDDYLAAVKARDCDAFREVTFIGSDIKPKEVCESKFAATADLAKRMRAHPSVRPRYEGGNASYGFLTFETTKPDENSTISVIKAGSGDNPSYLILDVAPSPTSLAQESIRKQIEKQQDDSRPDDMTPSKKPSEPPVTQ